MLTAIGIAEAWHDQMVLWLCPIAFLGRPDWTIWEMCILDVANKENREGILEGVQKFQASVGFNDEVGTF